MPAESVIAFFNRLAPAYHQRNAWVRWQHGQRTQAALELCSTLGGRVLDVGCGRGDLYTALLQRGYTGLYLGLDPAEAMLAHSDIPVAWRWTGDLHQWRAANPNAAPFDTIFVLGVSTYLTPDELRRTLETAGALLAPQGSMVVSITHAGSWENRWRRRLKPLLRRLWPTRGVWTADFPTFHYLPSQLAAVTPPNLRIQALHWFAPSLPFLHHLAPRLARWVSQHLPKAAPGGLHTDFLLILVPK